MKKFIFIIACVFFCFKLSPVQAQVEGEFPMTIQTQDYKNLQVYKDPRMDLLIQKQRYLNTLALKNIAGYRVQVVSTMDRKKAMDDKARLMQLFPEYETHLSYQSPYFRVRIGDFLNRNDAQELQKELDSYFPNGVFTVRDRIHISPEQLLQEDNHNDTDD